MAKKTEILLEIEDEENNTNEKNSSDENESNSEADDEISDTNDNENDNGLTNSGWADSISKILKTNKPKRKKAIVLSKAKKLTDLKKRKSEPAGFEVHTVDGEIKEETIDVEINHTVKEEQPHKKKRKLSDLRVKPNVLDKDRERTLQKVATKGVVQLFNAVKLQQKQIGEKLKEAGPLEVRREKVLKNIDKRAFLDVLMGGKSQKIDDYEVPKADVKGGKETEKSDSMWSVLKDDFMMSAKMKDWDKELEDSDDIQNIPAD